MARIAERQHGVVSIRQLHAVGLTDGAVGRRVRARRLHRVHRGVYAVGHAGLSREGRWMAAVLAYRDGAAISHRSAAFLWLLLTPRDEPVDVTIPGISGRGSHRGVRLHRSRTLTPAQTTRRRGIPVTTPARTVADLRRTASSEEARRAMRQAYVLGLPIDDGASAHKTRSDLEDAFLRLCRRLELPQPEVNATVDSLEVDFLWRDRRLIVETDGYRYHRGRVAFEHDRGRDLRLRALGFEIIRLSYRQVVDRPEQIAAVLRQKLL